MKETDIEMCHKKINKNWVNMKKKTNYCDRRKSTLKKIIFLLCMIYKMSREIFMISRLKNVNFTISNTQLT